ncbi:DUF4333 domain-containing protein [Pseudonocardia xinjiangensis]|uniref:DUF4333 domain-containing protein n=1 Tax=Pseudonocardia xinjiangensis TaxID=75289 RepID=A0ABX1RIR3_9PSEU|nr:DUF4333 domain-containing protein [Pseudonocardia xinjiangensis]NMH80280.1 DUF4333 domain-containing protein [Pseudonocardia xinjiangensis]
MSTPQGPSTPQGTPPGQPAEQPAWGQQPPGGWGQAQQDVELDPDETGAVPTQSAPEHDPPPKPAEFDKSRQQQQQQTETLPAMPPLGRPPQQPPAPPQPSPGGQPAQPPQAGPGSLGGPGPKLPQLPQHGLPQLGQPTPGVPLFGQAPPPGQPPYVQPSFGRPQQGPGQQYGQPGPGPAPFGSPGWGLSQQPTQQFPGQPQAATQRAPQAPEQRGGVKRLLPIVLGGIAVVALVALLGFVTPGFFVTRVFDPVALQSGVQHVLTQNYHMDVAGVRCEEGIRVDEGTRFECDATVDGASVKVPIIVTGSDGSYEVGRPS